MKPVEREDCCAVRPVKILTDSCADLSPELLAALDMDYAEMRIVRGGTEYPARLTWSPEEAHELYEAMRGGERVTTTQVPVEEFTTKFTRYLEAGWDVVYVACSSRQSGSVNTAALVADRLSSAYPGATVVCVDSLNASMGEGMLALEAARLAREGRTAREIEAHLLSIRKTVNEYVTVHSLTCLRRAGRVKGPAAFFGNLMGVKPIIISDADGEQAAYRKVKGRARSFEELVSLMKETVVAPEEQTLYLVHADCSEEELTLLESLVREAIPFREVRRALIGPIIGASIGPDAVGLIAFGKPVTFRVKEDA